MSLVSCFLTKYNPWTSPSSSILSTTACSLRHEQNRTIDSLPTVLIENCLVFADETTTTGLVNKRFRECTFKAYTLIGKAYEQGHYRKSEKQVERIKSVLTAFGQRAANPQAVKDTRQYIAISASKTLRVQTTDLARVNLYTLVQNVTEVEFNRFFARVVQQLPTDVFSQLISGAETADEERKWMNANKALLRSITKLNLASLELIWLPAEIGLLTEVEYLTLSRNNFRSLPQEILCLTKLKRLDISKNNLTSLPQEILCLTELTHFSISKNQFTSLSRWIWRLAKLQYLDISGNRLTSLSSKIKKLTKLEWLIASDNQIESLPSQIGHLRNLAKLEISWNRLKSLPSQLTNLRGLRLLDVRGYLPDSLTPEISSFIKSLPRCELEI